MASESRSNTRKVAASELSDRLGRWSDGGGPLYRQLADAIAGLVTEGALRHDDRLPAERAMALELSVSRGTVISAYDWLRDNGVVERVQGSGTIVRGTPSSFIPRGEVGTGAKLFAAGPNRLDLMLAVPAIHPDVRALLGEVNLFDGLGTGLGGDIAGDLDDPEPAGIRELREMIARQVTAEGLETSASEILVTAGAQQAVALGISAVVRPGDVVISEETCWPGLADSVRAAGGRLHGVSMDEHGIRTDELRRVVDRLRPSLIAVNPHHHNPTNTSLPPTRRDQVAEIAADYGAVLMEDRISCGLGFVTNVPAPLAAHRPEAPSIIADSLSKVAWPGLRLGWIRADAQLINEIRPLKATADLHTSMPSQLFAMALLPHLDEIRAARGRQLEARYEVLSGALRGQIPDWDFREATGGLSLWIRLNRGTASEFARVASRYGVAVAGGREFCSSVIDDEHLRIPFTAPPEVLAEGVSRLAEAWAEYCQAPVVDRLPAAAVI